MNMVTAKTSSANSLRRPSPEVINCRSSMQRLREYKQRPLSLLLKLLMVLSVAISAGVLLLVYQADSSKGFALHAPWLLSLRYY